MTFKKHLHIETNLYEFLLEEDEAGTEHIDLIVKDAPWEGDSSCFRPGVDFLPLYISPGDEFYFSLPLVNEYNSNEKYDFQKELQQLKPGLANSILDEVLEKIYLTARYLVHDETDEKY